MYTLSTEVVSETVMVVFPAPTIVSMSPTIVATDVSLLEKDKTPVPVLVTKEVSANGASVVVFDKADKDKEGVSCLGT